MFATPLVHVSVQRSVAVTVVVVGAPRSGGHPTASFNVAIENTPVVPMPQAVLFSSHAGLR